MSTESMEIVHHENGGRQKEVALLSEIVDRLVFARTHGLSYGGDRDIYKVAGYPRTLRFHHYADMYERDPIAGRIVDMVAETTWRQPPEIVEPDMPEGGTDFTKAWEELAKRLRVWQKFEAADKLARVGQYSVLMIGFQGGDDLALRGAPVGIRSAEDVLFLKPYPESLAKIDRWQTDPASERYGLPQQYRIDLAGNIPTFRASAKAGTTTVDASRALHVAEDTLDDDVFGRPTLRRLYNDLMDFQKVSASTGEAFWQRVAGILQAKLDPQVRWTDAQLADLDENLKELYHELRKTFFIQGGELSRIGDTEPDPSNAAKLYMQRIAAGAGIPARMLFGSETGERSSSEDQKTYLGMVADRQITHAEPGVLRPFIDRLVELGALPRPAEKGYDVVWPTLFQEPEKDVASANLDRAKAAQALTPPGGDPTALVEVDKDRNIYLVTRKAGDPSPFDLVPPPDPSMPPDGAGTATEDRARSVE